MREKLKTLSLAVLRDIAKDKNIKGISALRKNELIEAIIKASEADGSIESAEREVLEQTSMGARAAEAAQPQAGSQEKPQAAEAAQPQGGSQGKPQAAGAAQPQVGLQEKPQAAEAAQPQGGSQGKPQAAEAAQPQGSLQGKPQTAEAMQPQGSSQENPQTTEAMQPQAFERAVMRDEGPDADGILEVMPDGYGFIRCENYLPGENDVYVSPSQIRRFNLKTGDIIVGPKRAKSSGEKFSALLHLETVNGIDPMVNASRPAFESLTPIFPNKRIHLEPNSNSLSMRIVDLISPIGMGQRGMIVSQPKAGKTTLLKQIARSITRNNPDMYLLILLIDERPEEVTDIKESIEGKHVEVIYSTFDELPERHKRVSEMVIERAKRLVEQKNDVIILLDSITRLARAYNLTVQASGRTLSGGLDPAALHMPKRFFGAARNMREGGSLTILATALVETGSKMDDVIFEEFKGTGNMELVLDRKLSEKRIFPAIDIAKSSTRRDDLLLNRDEYQAMEIARKALSGMRSDEAVERILDLFLRTRSNAEFVQRVKQNKIF